MTYSPSEYRTDVLQSLGDLYRGLVVHVAALESSVSQYTAANYTTMHDNLTAAREAVATAMAANADSANAG